MITNVTPQEVGDVLKSGKVYRQLRPLKDLVPIFRELDEVDLGNGELAWVRFMIAVKVTEFNGEFTGEHRHDSVTIVDFRWTLKDGTFYEMKNLSRACHPALKDRMYRAMGERLNRYIDGDLAGEVEAEAIRRVGG